MLLDCLSQMLWTISNKLQVSIPISSSKEIFYKHMKGMELEFRKDKWKIKFEQSNLEEPTYNMKPPHCHT